LYVCICIRHEAHMNRREQTDKETNKQANRQTDSQTDRQTEIQIV